MLKAGWFRRLFDTQQISFRVRILLHLVSKRFRAEVRALVFNGGSWLHSLDYNTWRLLLPLVSHGMETSHLQKPVERIGLSSFVLGEVPIFTFFLQSFDRALECPAIDRVLIISELSDRKRLVLRYLSVRDVSLLLRGILVN